MRRLASVVAGALVLAAIVAGCGSDDSGSDKPTVTVSAAASLKSAFPECAKQFKDADLKFSFAGSDELAAQIRQGAKPDLFASANTKLPAQLAAEGKLDKPQVFAGNRLVIAVPKDSSISSIQDLEKPGTSVVIGSKTVPIGDYTRKVLGRLPTAQEAAITRNVKSQEPDVAGIVGKLTQGAADAGFTYVTDVVATTGALKAVELRANLQPAVAYAAEIVNGTDHQQEAQAFLDDVISGPCRQVMQEAGFTPAPS
jgi:molybdate transport system substrate-binding protein